ncbi:MAG TPA: hypothetical protein VGU23_04460, partial [Acidobacteriaceae bacterium]|nr:hypothetical protein [Acidobacteriaceae bacterium]
MTDANLNLAPEIETTTSPTTETVEPTHDLATVTQTRARCRHIHAAGHQCGSPALRKRTFCYYHDAAHRPHPNPRSHRYPEHNLQSFTLPVLE